MYVCVNMLILMFVYDASDISTIIHILYMHTLYIPYYTSYPYPYYTTGGPLEGAGRAR